MSFLRDTMYKIPFTYCRRLVKEIIYASQSSEPRQYCGLRLFYITYYGLDSQTELLLLLVVESSESSPKDKGGEYFAVRPGFDRRST